MQVRIKKLGHVGIAVRDIDRTIEFYRDIVGLHLVERFDYGEDEIGHGIGAVAGAFMRSDSTHHCLSIFKLRDRVVSDDGAHHGRPATGLHHIAFDLASPEDLLGKLREMKAAGVEILSSRKGGPGNQPRFYAKDPDGHLLEFHWGIDEIGWDGVPRHYEAIQEIDLEDFDFAGYLEQREADASDVRARLESQPASQA